ncbi:hypothetical protein DFH06DRAFT_693429 [Mycena polygramma]|nr:hypothetical protein DFH06DRAFT_693429 [Mycena polygramma]
METATTKVLSHPPALSAKPGYSRVDTIQPVLQARCLRRSHLRGLLPGSLRSPIFYIGVLHSQSLHLPRASVRGIGTGRRYYRARQAAERHIAPNTQSPGPHGKTDAGAFGVRFPRSHHPQPLESSFHAAIEFLATFPKLESLDFYPYCSNSSPTTLPNTAPPPNLRSLTLHSPFRHSESCWFTENRHRFQSLTLLDVKTAHLPRVAELCTAFGASLRKLCLRFSELSTSALQGGNHVLEFLSNTQLSSLEIDVSNGHLIVFFKLLEGIRSAPNLRVLAWSNGTSVPSFGQGGFPKLDARLADRAVFKSLREVHFITDDDELPNLLEAFPKADALGITMTCVLPR